MTAVKCCECGCGKPAPIATVTRAARGHIKGQPIRFIDGHAQLHRMRRARVRAGLTRRARALLERITL